MSSSLVPAASSAIPIGGRARRLARLAFAGAAALALGAGLLTVARLESAQRATDSVQHSYEVLGTLDEVRGAVAAVDEGRRDLLAALRPQTVADRHAHVNAAAAALARGRTLTGDNPEQNERFDSLQVLTDAKMAELGRIVTLIRQDSLEAARALAAAEEHDVRTRHIHALLHHMTLAEHDSLRARIGRHARHTVLARTYLLATVTASGLLVLLGGGLLLREERHARLLAAAATAAERQARASAEAARRSEARFRSALDAMHDAFLIARAEAPADASASPALVLEEANAAGAALLGTSVDRLVGRRLHELAPAHRRAELLAIYAHVLATGERFEGEIERRDPEADVTSWLSLQVVRTAEGLAVAAHDVTARRLAERALRELSVRDELTGLLNRRGFREAAEARIHEARAESRAHAVVSLDLTGFKGINDTYGHAEGDEALRAVARILREASPDDATVGRLGGDEFAIHVVGESAVAAPGVALAARLHAAFAEANAAAPASGRSYLLRTGIGVAELRADDMLDAALARADAALYADKGVRRTHPAA